MTKRVFLGIPVPLAHQKNLNIGLEPLQLLYPDFRFVDPGNYHITVTFLGGVEEEQVGEIQNLVTSVTSNIEPFTLISENLIFAPPYKLKRMLWEVFKENDSFTNLARSLESAIGEHITLPDYRKSHSPMPHITLARFKSQIVQDSLPSTSGTIRADKIILFESKPGPTGRYYLPATEFPLQQ